jgi:alpha-beta hydrolase superfamily lysophospholipase
MAIMKHPVPVRPELGTTDGLSWALFLPDEAPSAGVVICHGAGSAKESHFDYGRAARAMGMAALAYDARGHGHSTGALGASAWTEALAMCDVLRERSGAPEIALRGSSMGGFTAIGAASLAGGAVAAVAAICPAPEQLLLRGLRSGRLNEGMTVDREAIEPWLESVSLSDAAASLAPRTALLLMHARGDEQVPYTISQDLYAAAGEPKRLLLLPGGHHRSLQHDMEIQAASLRFIAGAVKQRAAAG